jgi:hypothetical protein
MDSTSFPKHPGMAVEDPVTHLGQQSDYRSQFRASDWLSSRYLSADHAAVAPSPTAVATWRSDLCLTSPATNSPGVVWTYLPGYHVAVVISLNQVLYGTGVGIRANI